MPAEHSAEHSAEHPATVLPTDDSPVKRSLREERDRLAAPVPLTDGARAFADLLRWALSMVRAGQTAEINIGTDRERTGMTAVWSGASPVAVVEPGYARDAVAAFSLATIPVAVLGVCTAPNAAHPLAILLRLDRMTAAADATGPTPPAPRLAT